MDIEVAVFQEFGVWWERKGSKLIKYRTDLTTLFFDHTRDLDLEVSRSKFDIILFQEWEGLLT